MAAKAELRGKITLNDSLFKAGLKSSLGAAKSFASSIGSTLKSVITSPLGAIGAALAGIFAFRSFAGGIAGAIYAGAEMKKLSDQTGVAVGTLSTLRKAFNDADMDADMLGSALSRMQRLLFSADKGSAQAHAALATLHLKFQDIIRLDPGEQFKLIGDRLLAIRNPTEKIGMAMMFFGKTGAQLIPVFKELGATDLGELSEKARIMQKNADAFFEIIHGFRRLGNSFRAIYLGIADQLVPVLKDVLSMVPKINFLNIGETIGRGIATAYFAIRGFVSTWRTSLPEIGRISMEFFKAEGMVWLSVWKIALGAIASAINTVFSKSFWTGIWSSMTDAFLDATKKMLSAFTGLGDGIEKMLGFSPDKIFSKISEVQKNVGDVVSGGGKPLMDSGMKELKEAGEIFRKVGTDLRALLGKAILSGTPKTKDEIAAGIQRGWRFAGFGGLQTGQLVAASMAGFLRSSSFHGPFKEGETAGAFTFLGSSLNRGAYNHTPVLRHSEIASIIDKAVASGQDRDNLSPGGYHAVRRGDASRRREFLREQQRQHLGLEKTNDILSDIDGKMTDFGKALNGES